MLWLLKLGITMLIHNKDGIEFVIEFPCFLGHTVSFFDLFSKLLKVKNLDWIKYMTIIILGKKLTDPCNFFKWRAFYNCKEILKWEYGDFMLHASFLLSGGGVGVRIVTMRYVCVTKRISRSYRVIVVVPP